MARLHFHFLTGDVNWTEYGGEFISRKLNNGDWDYWLILSVDNLEESDSDEMVRRCGKYLVSLSAVSPTAAGEKVFQDAWESWGMGQTFDEWTKDRTPRQIEQAKVEVLNSYMGGAKLGEWTGNNLAKLLRQAHECADTNGDFFFGFAMDRQQNALGADGWDWISGNLMGPLNPEEHARAHSSPEE